MLRAWQKKSEWEIQQSCFTLVELNEFRINENIHILKPKWFKRY